MSHHTRKPTICICESKDADQLWSYCTADQRLCFHYSVQSLFFLNPKFQASSPFLRQVGLCWTCLETILLVFSYCGSYNCIAWFAHISPLLSVSRGADPAVVLGGDHHHVAMGRSTPCVWAALDAHYILYF